MHTNTLMLGDLIFATVVSINIVCLHVPISFIPRPLPLSSFSSLTVLQAIKIWSWKAKKRCRVNKIYCSCTYLFTQT